MKSRRTRSHLPRIATLTFLALAGCGSTTRVLPPEAGEFLLSAFQADAGSLTLGGASLSAERIELEACLVPTGCEKIVLTDAIDGCAGAKSGAFCIGGEVSAAMTAALQRVLARMPDNVWKPLEKTRPGGVADRRGSLSKAFVALALFLVPLLAGLLIGFALRARRAWVLALAPVPLALAIGALFVWQPLAAWDVIACAGLVTLGVVVGGLVPFHFRGWIVAAVASCLLLVALEGAVRLLPAVPTTHYPEGPSLFVDLSARHLACHTLFPESYPEVFEERLGRSDRRHRRVLHLGDSMAAGRDGLANISFVHVLDARDPDRRHVNSAVGDTATDQQFAVATRWMRRAAFEEVVLHVFPSNDLGDINKPSACCGLESLLVERDGRLVPRCDKPEWKWSFDSRLVKGPAPYLLRFAAGRSQSGSRLLHAFYFLNESLWGTDVRSVSSEERLVRMGRVLEALKDLVDGQGAHLSIVVVPNRWAIAANDRVRHAKTVELARSIKVPVFDAWGVVAQAANEAMPGLWDDRDGPRDVHFGDAGHLVMADWLETQIWPRPLASPTESAP